jgi:TM2 domain-containing membrane protein YozV
MTPYAQMLFTYVRPEAQGVYAYEYEHYQKDPIVALALTLFLGIVGGESYYMGDYRRGILMSIALFTGIGLFISVPLWIVRCFTIQGECDTHNDWLAWTLAHRYLPSPNAVQPPEPPKPANATQQRVIGGLPMVAPR